MIGYLSGKIKLVMGNSIILDVNGVGYRVEVGSKGFLEDSSISIYIHTHVREQEISLYGFVSEKELIIFELLISVSGVGPKSALLLVLEKGTDNIISGIKSNNPLQLKAKGIGTKTTQKIILDLKSKVDSFAVNTTDGDQNFFNEDNYFEVIEALSSLGYRKNEIDSAIKSIEWPKEATTQDLIKQVLKLLQR